MADHEHASGTVTFEHAGIAALRAGGPLGARLEVGVAVARFNGRITDPLFAGAVDVLLEAGIDSDHIRAVQVPGAVELPLAARELIAAGCSAVVTLGCVIRGDTAHFDYVCNAVTDGCMRVTLDHRVPVGFGVITCETVEQAIHRSAMKAEPDGRHNVGAHAAAAVIEMLRLQQHLPG